MQEYCYKAYEPGVQKQIIDMEINGSGIRDTACVLGISKNTVNDTFKKKKIMSSISIRTFKHVSQKTHQRYGWIKRACDEAELDEQCPL